MPRYTPKQPISNKELESILKQQEFFGEAIRAIDRDEVHARPVFTDMRPMRWAGDPWPTKNWKEGKTR